MQRDTVLSTLIRHDFNVVCRLGNAEQDKCLAVLDRFLGLPYMSGHQHIYPKTKKKSSGSSAEN